MQWNVDDKTSQPNHENHQPLPSCIRAAAHLLSLELVGPDEFNLQFKVNSHRTTRYENDHFLITFYKEYNDACMSTLFVKSTMQLERRLGEGILHRKKVFPFPYLFFAMFFIQNKTPRIFFLLYLPGRYSSV